MLIDYAKSELRFLRAGNDEPDEMQDMIEAHILKLVEVFADEGHSGTSGAYTLAVLEKLLRFRPLTPLTGAEDEWTEVSEGCWQNRRCPSVFKDADGAAYDIDGKVFIEPNGAAYTGSGSRVPVTFPYTPSTERVHVDVDGNPPEPAQ